jgi:hypothetical protein
MVAVPPGPAPDVPGAIASMRCPYGPIFWEHRNP